MDMDDEIPTEQIRERAYDLWDRNHRPEGFEIEFWLMAERELRVERGLKGGDVCTAGRERDAVAPVQTAEMA